MAAAAGGRVHHLLIDRPAAGDLFIAFLNALAAAVLWREISKQTRT
jgi:hypothetical protein